MNIPFDRILLIVASSLHITTARGFEAFAADQCDWGVGGVVAEAGTGVDGLSAQGQRPTVARCFCLRLAEVVSWALEWPSAMSSTSFAPGSAPEGMRSPRTACHSGDESFTEALDEFALQVSNLQHVCG